MTTTTTSALVRRGLAAVAVVTLLLAGCGDDGDDDVGADDTSEVDGTGGEGAADAGDDGTDGDDGDVPGDEAPADPAADEAAVGAVLTEFFALVGVGDFDAAARLFENGEEHQPKLVHCAELVEGVTIEVTSVEVTGDSASALFAILKDGEELLAESGGGAVRTDEGWLVSENTFLSLYDAAKEGCTGTPPPE